MQTPPESLSHLPHLPHLPHLLHLPSPSHTSLSPQMRDGSGRLTDGVSVTDMGVKTIGNDLDNASITFDRCGMRSVGSELCGSDRPCCWFAGETTVPNDVFGSYPQ